MAGGFIPSDHVPGPDEWSLEEFAEAVHALREAHERYDTRALVARAQSNKRLLPEESELLADIVTGKWKRPRHRPKGPNKSIRNLLLQMEVLQQCMEGEKLYLAVSETARRQKLSDTTVWDAVDAEPRETLFAPYRPRR